MSEAWAERVVCGTSNREAWLEARHSLLTASDVANVLGLGSKSRKTVLREKISGVQVGADPGELAMVAAGRYLEAGVFAWFADETIHETAGMCGDLITAPGLDWLGATPDALLDGEPVECKVSGYTTRPNWHADTAVAPPKSFPFPFPQPVAYNVRNPPENLRVAAADVGTPKGAWRDGCRFQLYDLLPTFGPPVAPLKYWVQLQIQMLVLDAPGGWVVGLQGGTTRIDLYYSRDRKFLDWALERLIEFRNEWEAA